VGKTSQQNPQHPLPGSPVPSKGSSSSIEEFVSCCLLGKIWGESIPLHAIVHRTKNEWKSVKG